MSSAKTSPSRVMVMRQNCTSTVSPAVNSTLSTEVKSSSGTMGLMLRSAMRKGILDTA